jgi:hypothetical protein
VLVIDDFTTAQSLPENTMSCVQNTGILGGERDGRTFLDINVQINTAYPNQCYMTNPDNFGSTFFLTYDGPDGDPDPYNPDEDGLGNLDLTGGGQYTGFLISFSQGSGDGDYILITVGQTGDKISQEIFDLPASATDVFVPFTDFGGIIGFAPPLGYTASSTERVDFTDVGYIDFYIRVGPNSSAVIDSITVIPEPATLSLFALGAIWLRRKRT